MLTADILQSPESVCYWKAKLVIFKMECFIQIIRAET